MNTDERHTPGPWKVGPVVTLYKLTDREGYTRRGKPGETIWSEGLVVTATGPNGILCTDGVIHAYRDPILGIMLNSIHANIAEPLVWSGKGSVITKDHFKVGVKTFEIVELLEPQPVVTTVNRVAFAIYCALASHPGSARFRKWAHSWIANKDRSLVSARAAECASSVAVEVEASHAAGWAARAVPWSADWAAAWADVRIARVAAEAAVSAQRAEEKAARAYLASKKKAAAEGKIDFIRIAHKAMEVK